MNLTRRMMLRSIGIGTVALWAGCGPNGGPRWWRRLWSGKSVQASIPPCIVRAEQTEGPYFVDEKINRSDIRSDPSDGSVKEGVPLKLSVRVHEIRNGACAPLAGAMVDVWHCDALGVYGDVKDRAFDTRGKKFLRGYQITDKEGKADFLTIYPGWYPGRAVHIHFKIRTEPASRGGYEFTSQIYFDDAVTDQIHAQRPYNSDSRRRIKNGQDGIFIDGGEELIMEMTPLNNGYAGTFDIGLQLT